MPHPDFALKALAPVLIVDAVEPGLAFWHERLDFTIENQVPGDDGAPRVAGPFVSPAGTG